MTIERVLDGKSYTIELTEDEMNDAAERVNDWRILKALRDSWNYLADRIGEPKWAELGLKPSEIDSLIGDVRMYFVDLFDSGDLPDGIIERIDEMLEDKAGLGIARN